MDRNQAIIAVVAAVLVVFSLTVSMVVPKRNPGFPGKRLGIFLGVTLLLVAGMLTTVVVFGSEDAETEATPAAETQPAEPAPDTAPSETVPPGETAVPVETGGSSQGDAAAGATVFESAGCGSCHTLAAAGATGNVGPESRRCQATVRPGRRPRHERQGCHARIREGRAPDGRPDPERRRVRRSVDRGVGSRGPRGTREERRGRDSNPRPSL